MSFQYLWDKDEANFGPPIQAEVAHGTHISAENILIFEGQFVALRRPQAIPGHQLPPKAIDHPKDYLYFVHNLPRWGETLEVYLRRVVKEQAGVGVKSWKIIDLEVEVYEDTQQWAWTPILIVEIDALPKPGIHGNEVTEIVIFTINDIPDEFGWWEKDELRAVLEKTVLFKTS